MATCKGNRGNLLQHWTLCELLDLLNNQSDEQQRLHFVSAHAMAPDSTLEDNGTPTRAQFDNVRSGNPNQNSLYEKTWHTSKEQDGLPYPSSAVFVSRFWVKRKGLVSFCLCETDPEIAESIGKWAGKVLPTTRNRGISVFCGDWRKGIELDPRADINLVEFDPNKFSFAENHENNKMYPCDLKRINEKFQGFNKPLVIMISSYCVAPQNENEIEIIEETITDHLQNGGFSRLWSIHADGSMISLVFYKNIYFNDIREDTPARFNKWLGNIPNML